MDFEDENEDISAEEEIRKKLEISFEDYLKTYLRISSKEQYQEVISVARSKELRNFPDLFKPFLNEKQNNDILTEVVPLAQSNTMYYTFVRYLLTEAADKKTTKTTTKETLS